jgi:monofunctional glycosyltransferase
MARRALKRIRWFILVSLTALLGYAAWEYWRLPDVAYLKKSTPRTTAWMEMRAREAAAAGRKYRPQQIWRSYGSFSPWLTACVLAAEDAGFYSHHGFDYREIRESFKKNWEEKAIVRGASTITQQLAKNLFLSPSKNPVRKLKEVVLTYRLEKALSKNRILELYLNLIEWGDGIFGAEAAAQTYFGKPASALQVGEAALLAAMIVNPVRYSPYRKSPTLLFRYKWILERLHLSGKLDDAAYAAAQATPNALRGGSVFP